MTYNKYAFQTLLLCALATGCGSGTEPASPVAGASLEECRLPNFSAALRCGRVSVPENRADPTRRITLAFALLPAHSQRARKDPLLLLAGGPGQPATELWSVVHALSRLRRDRDIILLDQRGTGRSSPLSCELGGSDDPLTIVLQAGEVNKYLPECLKQLKADTRFYTTLDFVEDIESVRMALGYPQLNLWGGSYGTRVALEYYRRYPDRVRTLTLDGVAPSVLRINYDTVFSAERALSQTFADCLGSASCRRAFPRLEQDWRELLHRFEHDASHEVKMIHPLTGATVNIEVNQKALLASIALVLYAPEYAALLPQLITQAATGELAPLFAIALRSTADIRQSFNPGLQLSVLCAEEAHRISADELAEAERQTLRGAFVRQFSEACALWPHRSAPASFYEPVHGDVPALILSGALDPVTPPRWGDEAAKTLTRSRHLIAKGYGHIVSLSPCASRLVVEFVEQANAAKLPQECIAALEMSERPPFFTGKLGALP